jgi:hypothetical protein
LRSLVQAAGIAIGLAGASSLVGPADVTAQSPLERGGFTLMLDLGLQHDEAFGTTESGLAGINLGIGGFLSDRLALLLRASGTNVDYGPVRQVSGMAGPALQYWANDRLGLTGGVGLGLWSIEDVNESGLGLIMGVQFAVWQSGRHSLFLGLDYAPAFTDPGTVHNIGILFGWQLL